MDQIKLRLVALEDMNEVLTFMQLFNEEEGYPFDREKAVKNLHQLINHSGLGRIWLIEELQNPVGYVFLAFGFSFEYGGRDAFVDEFFIQTENRGRGIGEYAMNEVLAQAKLLGVNTVHLEVEKDNPAKKLYDRLDFKTSQRYLMSRPL